MIYLFCSIRARVCVFRSKTFCFAYLQWQALEKLAIVAIVYGCVSVCLRVCVSVCVCVLSSNKNASSIHLKIVICARVHDTTIV